MEILALFLTVGLMCALIKIASMNNDKQIYDSVKQQLAQVQQDLRLVELSLMESNNELRAAEVGFTHLTEQYSTILTQTNARLFFMEVSAYIHHHGVLRQALNFNDEMVREFLSSVFYALLIMRGDINAELKATEYSSKEHFRKYFMDYIKFSRSGEFLMITGVEGYDLVNEIIAKICMNSTDSVLGNPIYKFVKLPAEI